MRLHLGPVPDAGSPDSSWCLIREPGPFAMQAIAVPIGLAAAILAGYCWHLVGGFRSFHFQGGLGLLALMLSMPALIVVHELLHAIVHPHFGCSPSTILGVWPSRLLCYAHYSEPLARDRLLTVFVMPFLMITILPLAIAASGVLSPGLKMWAAWFSTWNALFACGDYFGIALILFHVPRAAIVQNQGWRAYWKPK